MIDSLGKIKVLGRNGEEIGAQDAFFEIVGVAYRLNNFRFLVKMTFEHRKCFFEEEFSSEVMKAVLVD